MQYYCLQVRKCGAGERRNELLLHRVLPDCRTGSMHLGPCIRALCAPHWNTFLPSSPEALRTFRRESPLLAREGN
jgi:hypothetical protein